MNNEKTDIKFYESDLSTSRVESLWSSPGANRPDHAEESFDLIVFDRRCCIREALSKVLQAATDKTVMAVSSISQLKLLSARLNSIRTIILHSIGDMGNDRWRKEVSSIQSVMSNARLCVLADQVDSDIDALFNEYHLQGVIPSEFDTRQLLACLKIIDSGVEFLPADARSGNTMESNSISTDDSAVRFKDVVKKLTPRQQQILGHIAVGRSNKYIAAELSLSESTVKVHVSDLMKRLGATSRTHAVHLCVKPNA